MSKQAKRANPLLDSIQNRISSGTLNQKECTHRSLIQPVSVGVTSCRACLELGDTWVHLRMCMICGHVGCCNDFKNKHAAKHYLDTEHPIMRSIEPGESWMWCYVDQTRVETS